MDVQWGYNNIQIAEGDEWKAAFRTSKRLYEPTVMFFSLTNSPATFQTFMNHVLHELIDGDHVIVYLDNILVFTDTLHEHRRIVHQVLEVLRKHNLYLCPEKCSFEKETVEYLGTIVGKGGVCMDPAKVNMVTGWPVPKCKHDVQSCLGFCHFYQWFIQGFSAIAHPPLTKLTGSSSWAWGEEQQKTFE